MPFATDSMMARGTRRSIVESIGRSASIRSSTGSHRPASFLANRTWTRSVWALLASSQPPPPTWKVQSAPVLSVMERKVAEGRGGVYPRYHSDTCYRDATLASADPPREARWQEPV
jgi:hypothetical protein